MGRFLSLFFIILAIALCPRMSDAQQMPAVQTFADEENCIMCHKFPGLTRVDKGERLRLLFINEALVKEGPHFRVKCSECHSDIKKIPHETPIKEVDCLRECHVMEPSTGKRYTHKRIQDFIDKSVHSKTDKDGRPKKYEEDTPVCKNCHKDNPLYKPVSYFKEIHSGLTERSFSRCSSCHEKREFVESFYKHVSSRVRKSSTAQEVIELCGSCHEDREVIKRHELKNVVYTYKETFHGKSAMYGGKRQPDCTDCHVRAGESIHLIRKKDDVQSSVNKNNVLKTCSQIDCHQNAGPNLGRFKVHLETHSSEAIIERYTFYLFIILTAGVLIGLFIVMFLEQLRSFFPDSSIFKERGRDGR